MEVVLEKASAAASASKSHSGAAALREEIDGDDDAGKQQRQRKQVRVRRRTLWSVLEECQRALELLEDSDLDDPTATTHDEGDGRLGENEMATATKNEDDPSHGSLSSPADDSETDELCDLIKSRVESPGFLEKLGSIHNLVPQNVSDESTSWDVVTETDLWEEKHTGGENASTRDGDDYVLVMQEDIVDGIACFMAAYLLSLKQTKELTPSQLQGALSKTFSVKKRKGKLQKAWDGGKVIYNVASWGATAIGIYQNPALLRAASLAFWTSCRVISKLF